MRGREGASERALLFVAMPFGLKADEPPAWMLETTARNLRILLEPLRRAGHDLATVQGLADGLTAP